MVDLPRSAREVLAELDHTPFSRKDVHVINTVFDSTTRSRGKELFGSKFRSVDQASDFLDELPRHRGELLFVVGHVEDGAIVTRTANGSETLRIGLSTLEERATAEGVDVIVLGCGAGTMRGVSGTTGAINTVTALEHLDGAMDASTMGAMISNFAGAGHGLALERPLVSSLKERSVPVLRGAGRLSDGSEISLAVAVSLKTTARRQNRPADTPSVYIPFLIVLGVSAGLYLVVRVITSVFFGAAEGNGDKAEARPMTGVEAELMARANHQAALCHAAEDRLRSAFQLSDRAAMALIRAFDARDFSVCRQLPEILGSLLEWALMLRAGITSQTIADEIARTVSTLLGEHDSIADELLDRFVAVIVECPDKEMFARIVEKISLSSGGSRVTARILQDRERLRPSGKIRIGCSGIG